MKSDPTTRLEVERLRRKLAHFHTAKRIIIWILIILSTYTALIAAGATNLILLFFIFPDPHLAIGVFLWVTYAAILVAIGVIFLFLFQNHWLRCPYCGARTAIMHTWVCGSCDKEHSYCRTYWKHSFLEQCARCPNKPHSLICFNCREPVVFDDRTYNPKTPAWLPDYPPVTPTPAPVEERPPKLYDEDLR
jgi:hypothetical protein